MRAPSASPAAISRASRRRGAPHAASSGHFRWRAYSPNSPVLDNVALAVQARAGHSFRFWRPARRDPALREPARACLAQVGLAGRAEIIAGILAHGEKRALELAMVLATQPRLLLLDEPMAGMGPRTPRAWCDCSPA